MSQTGKIKDKLKTELSEDLAYLETLRQTLISKGRRNKLIFLLTIMVFSIYAYLDAGFYEYGEEGISIFGGLLIILMLIYIYTKTKLFIPKKEQLNFYKFSKQNIFQKCISIIDSKAIYKPLYKTHISQLKISQLFGTNFEISKEGNCIIFNNANTKTHISELHVYKGLQKTFKGLFVSIAILNSKEERQQLIELFDHYSNLISNISDSIINYHVHADKIYLSIPLKNEFFELEILEKKKISFNLIERDLELIFIIIQMVEQIEKVNISKVFVSP